MIHELKIEPQYYEDIKIGLKTFEIRKNDREFKLGDILILNEYDSGAGTYTGQKILIVRVTYLLNDPEYCKEGYVILGIIPVGERHG